MHSNGPYEKVSRSDLIGKCKQVTIYCIMCNCSRVGIQTPEDYEKLALARLANQLMKEGWSLGFHPNYPGETYYICPKCEPDVKYEERGEEKNEDRNNNKL